jgi:hypothetical protein
MDDDLYIVKFGVAPDLLAEILGVPEDEIMDVVKTGFTPTCHARLAIALSLTRQVQIAPPISSAEEPLAKADVL